MRTHESLKFQHDIFRALTFSPEKQESFTLYRNRSRPELGYCIQYKKAGHYVFGIADYTIPRDFSLPFSQPATLMRFGTFYAGQTEYQVEGHPVSFTTPSSFFVIEKDLNGVQRWQKGQHYHGTEVTIFEPYFSDVIEPLCPFAAGPGYFRRNHTYNYLPEEVIRIIEHMVSLAEKNHLSALYLESKIMECVAIFTNVLHVSPDNAFTYQIDYGNVSIGENRHIRLNPADIRAIQTAHDILSKEAQNPPTIGQLALRVFLGTQKLKAGFNHYYHMSIGSFVQSVRMTRAANLLVTTDLSVNAIAREVGYHHSSNFARVFRKTYNKMPLVFRRSKGS